MLMDESSLGTGGHALLHAYPLPCLPNPIRICLVLVTIMASCSPCSSLFQGGSPGHHSPLVPAYKTALLHVYHPVALAPGGLYEATRAG